MVVRKRPRLSQFSSRALRIFLAASAITTLSIERPLTAKFAKESQRSQRKTKSGSLALHDCLAAQNSYPQYTWARLPKASALARRNTVMPSLHYIRLIYVRVSLIAFVIFIGSLPGASQAAPKSVQERLGYPASARLLILHADDFGMNHSVNRATSEALEHHWITSASILVPCPWFLEAANFAKAHPDADLGIHQALTSEWTTFRWGPVTSKDQVSSLLDSQGYLPLDTPAVAENAKSGEVEKELHAQIDRSRSFGIHPTHLDTHMTALFETPMLFSTYQKMGAESHLPIL